MSSDVLARVQAFWRKAAELEDRGHILRAADYFGRAAEAARALGPDNLVAVDMQRCQALMTLNYTGAVADLKAAVNPLAIAAHRAVSVAQLSAVTAALERRRVAGTLLEAKCTAAEVAWFAARLRVDGISAQTAAWQAPLVGYEVFLFAALSFSAVLSNARYFAAECSAAQFEALAQHVVHATDMMQLPRSHGTTLMDTEAQFVEVLSDVVAKDLCARGLDASLVQLVTDAWLRLQRSGVLESRGILDGVRRIKELGSDDELAALAHAAMTAPGRRSCALAGCGAKEAHPQHFKSCAACRTVVYCRREHQVEGWPAHKKECKAACKAKAASSDGAAGPGAAS